MRSLISAETVVFVPMFCRSQILSKKNRSRFSLTKIRMNSYHMVVSNPRIIKNMRPIFDDVPYNTLALSLAHHFDRHLVYTRFSLDQQSFCVYNNYAKLRMRRESTSIQGKVEMQMASFSEMVKGTVILG